MKILLCTLLIFSLSLPFSCVHAEKCPDPEPQAFSPLLANVPGLSADEWFAQDESRALLTLLLSCDFPPSPEMKLTLDTVTANTSYIAFDSPQIIAVYSLPENNRLVIITYNPADSAAEYSILNAAPAEGDTVSYLSGILNIDSSQIHKNNPETLHKITELPSSSLCKVQSAH